MSLIMLAGMTAACTNPVSTGGHARVDNVVILLHGDVLATGERTTSDGTIMLEAGAELGPVTVEFRHRGEAVVPGSDFFFEITVADAAIANFEVVPAAAGFAGVFRGVAPGTTTMSIRLMHGRPGSPRAHPDFESAPVPLVVAPGE